MGTLWLMTLVMVSYCLVLNEQIKVNTRTLKNSKRGEKLMKLSNMNQYLKILKRSGKISRVPTM